MKFILGTKIGMTRIFDSLGASIPVTVIKVNNCRVVGKRTKDKDNYEAVRIGYGELPEKKISKPYKGIFKKAGVDKSPKLVKEFKLSQGEEYTIGQQFNVDVFKEGDYVDVTGISKGKGFAGGMKRHGFKGLPSSHGHGEYRRAPGSLSASSYPSRVFKGKKLPGHMGSARITVQKLAIAKVDNEVNILFIKGSVPGINGSIVSIRETSKR